MTATATATRKKKSQAPKAKLPAKERKRIKQICEDLVPLGRERRKVIKRQQLINQPAEADFVSRLCKYPEYVEIAETKKGVASIFGVAKKLRKKVIKIVSGSEFHPIYAGLCSASRHADRRVALDEFRVLFIRKIRDSSEQHKANGKKPTIELTDCHIEVATALCSSVMADSMSLKVFDEVKSSLDEAMCSLAEQLHVYPWWESVRGVASQGLASVISETGDLFNYSTPAKVWKRLGLAPYSKTMADGSVVTKACSTWKRAELTKAEWTDAGYSKKRRAVIYAGIGQCLVKQGRKYHEIYVREKERAVLNHPEWLQKDKNGKIKMGHFDKHAQRYIEKRLIRQLWRHWWATT